MNDGFIYSCKRCFTSTWLKKDFSDDEEENRIGRTKLGWNEANSFECKDWFLRLKLKTSSSFLSKTSDALEIALCI